MNLKLFIPLFVAVGLAFPVAAPSARKNSHIYATWQYVEMDRAASTWLIKRFVDKDAEFRVVKNGILIKEGIPFDTPDSELRRDRNVTTFEAILRKHKIKNSALDYIAKIVWDMEVNVWDKKITPESRGVNAVVVGLSRISKNDVECYKKCWPVFDALYAEVRSRK